MCMHFTFIKIVYIFFLIMFLYVFISDYKTWMPTFKCPFSVKKIHEEIKDKENVNI